MRLSPTFRLIALAVLLSLGIGALFAYAVLTIKEDGWNYARTTNANLVQALKKSVGRSLDNFNRSMVGLADNAAKPEIMALPPELRDQVLFDHSLRSPAVAAVSVSDAKGRVLLHSSGRVLAKQVNLATADYFIAHSSAAQEGRRPVLRGTRLRRSRRHKLLIAGF